MRIARLLGGGFLILTVVITLAVSQGWLTTSPPLAVFPTPAPDPAETVTIELVYGSEKERWLRAMTERWLATNPTVDGRPIAVTLRSTGSQQLVNDIATGTSKPTAVYPASTLQIEQINDVLIEGQDNRAADSAATLYSPLVVVAWEPRSDEPAAQLAQSGDLLRTVRDLVVAERASRRFLLGQTAPDRANSGLQTFVLLAYAYHNKTSNLSLADIRDPGFVAWITEYAQAVERFESGTGPLIDAMIARGPSVYRAGIVYESTAIARMDAAQGRWGRLLVLYPQANVWSDHPLALLDAPWVSAEERDAARLFRDFLLAEEQQRAAVTYGFRPANESVSLDGADSPFARYGDLGIKRNIDLVAETPGPEVVSGLLALWEQLRPTVNTVR